MDISEVSKILGTSELTVRRNIISGNLVATKDAAGKNSITSEDLLRFILSNKKYTSKITSIIETMVDNNEITIKKETVTDNIDELQMEIMKNVVKKIGTDLLNAFDEHLLNQSAKEQLPCILSSIQNKLYVTEQPTMADIVKILNDVLYVGSHDKFEVGNYYTGDDLLNYMGRKPQQEGINFCTSTNELYVITKIGSDNPIIDRVEYNDYWNMGKIMYEGKGQDVQEVKGSNLHLYRKYQVFHNKIKCKKDVPEYIHVFNKISNTKQDKFQYLGIFDVTDYFVNEESMGRYSDTKIALVFELTPRVQNSSDRIDSLYEF